MSEQEECPVLLEGVRVVSWSPDLYIGELRSWPDTVHVVRIGTEEMQRYVPERTCHAELMPKDPNLRISPWLKCSECGSELSAYGTDRYCHGCGAKVVSE